MTDHATAQADLAEHGPMPDHDLDVDATADEIPAAPEPTRAAHHTSVANGGNLGPSRELVAAPPAAALVAGATARERIKVAREIATQLDDIIKEQGLRTQIGNKQITKKNGQKEWVPNFHIDIEAWQTLAAFLEIAAVPVWTRRVIDPSTGEPERVRYTVEKFIYPKGTKKEAIKNGTADVEAVERSEVDGYSWEARVEVYKGGELVGAGESMVSRTERDWRDSDDYAVRSMAQTRAASKAIASVARWIVTLAGYSGNPADREPENGDVERAGALQPASEELRATAHNALAWLLAGDAAAVDRLEERLKAQYDNDFPAVVLQAVLLVAAAVKNQREAAA